MESLPARFFEGWSSGDCVSRSHNIHLHSSQIPEDMKNARVVLLYKNEERSKTEPGNYRPVPILIVTRVTFNVDQGQLHHVYVHTFQQDLFQDKNYNPTPVGLYIRNKCSYNLNTTRNYPSTTSKTVLSKAQLRRGEVVENCCFTSFSALMVI